MDSVTWQVAGANLVYRALVTSCRLGPESGVELLDEAVREPRPLILSFWHSRILGCVRSIEVHLQSKGHPIRVLISRSRDGEIIARFLARHGVGAARGSSSRGGGKAMLALARYLEDSRGVVVTTPDGPRGPSRVLKPGTVRLAQLSGAPIVPMSFAASRATRLRSWDRFIVPHPFSRIAIVAGEPIEVGAELDEAAREATRQRVEAAIRKADEAAAAVFGVEV